MKNRNSRMREIAFHTLFCMVSMVSILLTMQKKYTSESGPLQAQITMREFQFFESIIEKNIFLFDTENLRIFSCVNVSQSLSGSSNKKTLYSTRSCQKKPNLYTNSLNKLVF
jgi:hypothetical protein